MHRNKKTILQIEDRVNEMFEIRWHTGVDLIRDGLRSPT